MVALSYAEYYGGSKSIISGGKFLVPLVLGDNYLAANQRAITHTFPQPEGMPLLGTIALLGFSKGKYSYIITGTVSQYGENWIASFETDHFGDDLICHGLYDWTITIVNGNTRISVLTNLADNYRVKIVKKRT